MRAQSTLAVAIALAPFLVACAERRAEPNTSEARMGDLEDLQFEALGATRRAAVYVPAAYSDSDSRWPLVVFLHGLGERGSDNRAQLVGIYPAIESHPERFQCLVLMPQCPGDRVWVPIPAPWASGIEGAEDVIDAAIEATLARFRVDPDRVTLTGLSMGGFGTLVHGAARIDRFAALVAVCGGGRADDAALLARRPLWLIHGAEDRRVPPESSLAMRDAVRAAGGDVRFTLLEGVGHDAWTPAYADPAVIRFLVEAR